MKSDTKRGARLREQREARGWTQQEAANAVGVRREMWAKYEAGSEPGAGALSAMALAGIDVLYVLTNVRALRTPDREDAHMYREAAIREPEGSGPFHDMLRKTLEVKTLHSAKRQRRLAPIIERLSMCTDEDFTLVEAMLARIFGDTATPTQKRKGEPAP